MDTNEETPVLFDTSDLLLVGAIGLTTVAWFKRQQLKELIFGKHKVATPTAGSGTAAAKKEANFVKVMQEQVKKKQHSSGINAKVHHHHLIPCFECRAVESLYFMVLKRVQQKVMLLG